MVVDLLVDCIKIWDLSFTTGIEMVAQVVQSSPSHAQENYYCSCKQELGGYNSLINTSASSTH